MIDGFAMDQLCHGEPSQPGSHQASPDYLKSDLMTKADWVQSIKKSLSVNQKEATDLVEIVLELIKMALERGEKVKISGFGRFVVREKKERMGRNPQTGEPIVIAARRVLAFKPSAVLKKKLNS